MESVKKFKIGQKINHWSYGWIVEGEIIEISESKNEIKTKHIPVSWGLKTVSETVIYWSEKQNAWTPGIVTDLNRKKRTKN